MTFAPQKLTQTKLNSWEINYHTMQKMNVSSSILLGFLTPSWAKNASQRKDSLPVVKKMSKIHRSDFLARKYRRKCGFFFLIAISCLVWPASQYRTNSRFRPQMCAHLHMAPKASISLPRKIEPPITTCINLTSYRPARYLCSDTLIILVSPYLSVDFQAWSVESVEIPTPQVWFP